MRQKSISTTILMLVALLLGACSAGQNEATAPEPSVAPPSVIEASPSPMMEPSPSPMMEPSATVAGATNATLAEITANPEAYVGQTVTVEGGVNTVKSETAFTIADNTLTDLGEVLVVSAMGQSLDMGLRAEEPVRVTGTVRTFEIADINRDLNLNLDPETYRDFDNKPVLVASSVEVIEEEASADTTATPVGEWNATAPTEAVIGAEAGGAETAALTVAELTSNAERYLDQRVSVRSDLNSVIGPDAFVLDEDAPFDDGIDRDLLVISGTQGDVVEEGVEVEVGGVVRMLDIAEIEQTTGRDLDDAALQMYVGRPVVVASYVRAVPVFAAPDVESAIGAVDPTITERYGRNITVAEVAGNSADFLGKTVNVRGSVQEQLGQRALVLDENALLAGGIDNDLLVISASDAITVTDDDLVQVNGTVRSFDLAQMEQELGADLDDALFTDYAGRPVLVAQQITISATPAAIAADPARYAGRQVAVLGEVEQVIGQGAFSLDEDALLEAGIDNDLLVIRADPSASTLNEGIESRTVQVIGTVRALITAEIERDYGLTLDSEILVEYEGRPVVVATSVQVVER